MACDDSREALSAQLDGEDPGMDATRLDEHLSECGACRRWLADAIRVTRAVRLEGVDMPDLTGAVLARVRHEAPSRRGRLPSARAALFAVAAGQAAAAAPALLGVDVIGAVPVHSMHELGAFNLALAVAFGWTAWKPARARAHLPLLSTLVAVLVTLTVADVALGRVSAAVEAGHLLLIAGLVLTGVLARGHAEPGRPPSGTGTLPETGEPRREAA